MAWLETTFLIQTPLQTRTDRGEKVESNEREPKDGWVFGNEPWANKCQALVNQTDEAIRRRGQGVLGLSHKQRLEHEQTMESVRIVQINPLKWTRLLTVMVFWDAYGASRARWP